MVHTTIVRTLAWQHYYLVGTTTHLPHKPLPSCCVPIFSCLTWSTLFSCYGLEDNFFSSIALRYDNDDALICAIHKFVDYKWGQLSSYCAPARDCHNFSCIPSSLNMSLSSADPLPNDNHANVNKDQYDLKKQTLSKADETKIDA